MIDRVPCHRRLMFQCQETNDGKGRSRLLKLPLFPSTLFKPEDSSMLTATNYSIKCLLTNIVDLDTIACEVEPDRALVDMFQNHIAAMGCVPYLLPVWETGFDSYEVFPTETNASMLQAIGELAAEDFSPAMVTVYICPSKEHAAVMSSFIAEWEPD
jgi:hypothetical protein